MISLGMLDLFRRFIYTFSGFSAKDIELLELLYNAIRRIYKTGYGFWPFLMHRLDQPPDYFFVFKFGVLTRALVG